MKHIAKSLIVAALAALTSPSVLAATPALGIADDTLESVSFADGFSGLVAEWLFDMYSGVKAQILEWDADSGRFAVAGEQANEDEWPNFQFSGDASAGPVTLQVVFIRRGGEEVSCTNAVGYAWRTVPAGKMQLVSIPYRNIASEDGTYKFGETQVANDLPLGSEMLFWDESAQTWNGGTKTVRGWPSAQANHVLGVGEAFFVKNNSGGDLTVTSAGVLPSAATQTRSFAAGKWSAMAVPYPVEVTFGDTELAVQLPQGSTVLFWDVARQKWSGGAKSAARGWAAAQAYHVIAPGEGFFVQSPTAGTWVAARPYASAVPPASGGGQP